MAGHPQLRGVDPDVEAGERMAQAVQARRQAQVVQDRRAEPGDRGPGLVKGRGGQLLSPADLLGGQGGVGADDVRGGGQVEEQADDPLADPVVDLPGQAAAFPLLPFHDAFREALQGLLAFGQPAVQPGVLDGPGDQAGDRAEQFHVGAGELPPGPGVHVEHAHQVPERGHDRHRHHRGELLAAQRRDVAVTRVGGLVVEDHHRLAVLGDPPRHALAHCELDLPGEAVERRGGAVQPQHPALLVEQVHEAHVGGRGLGDQRGHALQHPVQVQAGRDRVDDPEQQLGLAVRVDAVQPGAGQWNTPSRSATVTAAARSETPSLR